MSLEKQTYAQIFKQHEFVNHLILDRLCQGKPDHRNLSKLQGNFFNSKCITLLFEKIHYLFGYSIALHLFLYSISFHHFKNVALVTGD